MGPGETRRSRHKRDVNCGLMKNINGIKSKLSIKKQCRSEVSLRTALVPLKTQTANKVKNVS